MKQFIKYSKLLLIVVAVVGLTVGMSTITGCDKPDDDVQSTVKDADVKTDVKAAKCGEGKCGEGKCGGDDVKAAVSDNMDDTKEMVKEAKCGEGKCG
jgi:uncharacterized low-complexity protein